LRLDARADFENALLARTEPVAPADAHSRAVAAPIRLRAVGALDGEHFLLRRNHDRRVENLALLLSQRDRALDENRLATELDEGVEVSVEARRDLVDDDARS